MLRGCDRERGAVAVLLSIVLIAVLLPLAAAGLSTYVRAGTAAELQRSADSAALAGARSIPIGNLSVLPPAIGPVPPEPLTVACQQAVSAAAADDAFGEDYAGSLACDARYLYDPDFLGRFQTCTTALTGSAIGALGALFNTFHGLLPALHHPGVEVTVSRTVGPGPMDALIPGADAVVTETRTARAIRRFKNAIVIPVIRNPATGDMVLDLNIPLATARQTLLTALSTVDDATGLLLPSCANVVDALVDDFADLYNPGSTDAPTAEEVVADAQAQGTALMAFVLDSGSGIPCLLCGLQVPALEFMPLCVTSYSNNVVNFAGCSASALGAFRASLVQ